MSTRGAVLAPQAASERQVVTSFNENMLRRRWASKLYVMYHDSLQTVLSTECFDLILQLLSARVFILYVVVPLKQSIIKSPPDLM